MKRLVIAPVVITCVVGKYGVSLSLSSHCSELSLLGTKQKKETENCSGSLPFNLVFVR